MKAFDFAVGLGPVGTAALVDDAAVGEGLVEQPAPIAEGVVGEDPFDDDAVGLEPGLGATPEGGGGGAGLVDQDLGVGEAAVVVEGGVEVGVAQASAAASGGPAMGAVPAPGRDAAQLLDIYVDQLTGRVSFIAADGDGSGPIKMGKPVEVVADQHPIDGRGGSCRWMARRSGPTSPSGAAGRS